MRGEHQGRALFERVPQRWQRRLNPGVVPDRAICDRHVEIDTEQNALAGEVEVSNRALPQRTSDLRALS